MKHFGLKHIGLLAFAFFLAAGCNKHDEAKIGALLPLSGDAGSYGERGRKGIELALDDINAKGGVAGRQLKVIFEDSRAEPRTGVAAMSKLVNVDKVPVVVGDIVSAVTLAVAPTAEANKVVLLSPTASAPAISHAGDFIFRIWPSDLAEGKAMANFAYKAGYKRIGILYMTNDYGIGLKDAFSKDLAELGGEITLTSGYKPDESDFRSYLAKLASSKPDAIYLISYYRDGGFAIKQARELGLRTQFLATTAIEDPKLFDITGKAAEGVIYLLATGYDPGSPDTTVQSFRSKYKDRNHVEPDWVSAQTYDALELIAYVMEKGGFDGPSIQKNMAQVKGYHGVTGEITFDENGDVKKPVVIKIIKNGAFQKYERDNGA